MESNVDRGNPANLEPTEDPPHPCEEPTSPRTGPPAAGDAGGRLDQLDSLRGIAALTVVACHMLDVYPTFADRPLSHAFWWLKVTPLHGVWAGQAAVLFFFILSGFVLSLPFHRGPVDLKGFLVKRICRIYIPYIATIACAIGLRGAIVKPVNPVLSSWFNDSAWHQAITSGVIAEHVVMVGGIKSQSALAPVIWSLVHEMRLSMVFPLLMLAVHRYSWRVNIGAGFALAAAGFAVRNLGLDPYGMTGFSYSAQYTVLFIVGALMAKHRMTLLAGWWSLPAISRWCAGGLAVLLYTYPYWFFPNVTVIHVSLINDTVTALGASVFIVAALGSDKVSRRLQRPTVLTLGRASYSLYLFHTLVLLSLLCLLHSKMTVFSILVLAFLVTFPVTAAAYFLFEVPSIQLGRSLAARIETIRRHRAAATPVP